MRKRKSPICLFRWATLGFLAMLLAGCEGGVLDPKGHIAAQEKELIIIATVLMLLVVVPVIIMTLVFAWKYRASNTKATYLPKWSHSGKIEATVWAIPCIIILILGVIIWETTHSLDPYKPIDHEKDHINVQVISLNWKWLFIYPDQGIATVNELTIPKDTPVSFDLTSQSTMNSFFIPQLGTQIYAMAAMKTKLHLIANEAGTFYGFSANYSGGGFTGMDFDVHATETEADFDQWVQKVRAQGSPLTIDAYKKLTAPTENNPVQYFSTVKPGLFMDVIHQFGGMTNKPFGPLAGFVEEKIPAGHHAHSKDEVSDEAHPVTEE